MVTIAGPVRTQDIGAPLAYSHGGALHYGRPGSRDRHGHHQPPAAPWVLTARAPKSYVPPQPQPLPRVGEPAWRAAGPTLDKEVVDTSHIRQDDAQSITDMAGGRSPRSVRSFASRRSAGSLRDSARFPNGTHTHAVDPASMPAQPPPPDLRGAPSLRRRNAVRIGAFEKVRALLRRLRFWRGTNGTRRRLYFSRTQLAKKPSMLVTPDASTVQFTVRGRNVFRLAPRVSVRRTAKQTGKAIRGEIARAIALRAQGNNKIFVPPPPPHPESAELDEAESERLSRLSPHEFEGHLDLDKDPNVRKISLPLRADGDDPLAEDGAGNNADKPLPETIAGTNALATAARRESRRRSRLREGPTRARPDASQPTFVRDSVSLSVKDHGEFAPPVLARRDGSTYHPEALVVSEGEDFEPVSVDEVMEFVHTWGSYLRRSIAVRAVLRKEMKSMELQEEERWRRSLYEHSDSSIESFDSISSDSSTGTDSELGVSESAGSRESLLSAEQLDNAFRPPSRPASRYEMAPHARAPVAPPRQSSVLHSLPKRYSALFSRSDSEGAPARSVSASTPISASTAAGRAASRRAASQGAAIAAATTSAPSAGPRNPARAGAPIARAQTARELARPGGEALWLARAPSQQPNRSQSARAPIPTRLASAAGQNLATNWRTLESSDEELHSTS